MAMAPLLTWLLDSDPGLRWQVERDLAHEPPEVWEATRARVATEGFGAQLLALQDSDGQWAGGAFFPADFDFDGPEVDCCINAWTVSNGLWLGADIAGIVDWFLGRRMDDGGWNCEWVEGSTRSSFHSTLNALKGLLDYDVATGGTDATHDARLSGEEYLLARGLFRRLSTTHAVAPWIDRFTYPVRAYYTVLNAADYFRRRSLHDGTPPDPRMAEAIELIRAARQSDGTWLQAQPLPGQVWFEVDVPEGEPSKWLTLHGTRVLDWWDAQR